MMQAIATLALDDPYLKQTAQQRCDARRERKRKLSALSFVQEIVEVPPDKTHRIELPIIPEPEPESQPDPVIAWAERQRAIYKPWFSIEEEILPVERPRPKIEEIQRACARHYGLTLSDIISARKSANVVRPRQIAYYLAKTLTLKSLPEIGRRFGGRDHTTALYGIRKIERLRKTDEGINGAVLTLAASLGWSIA